MTTSELAHAQVVLVGLRISNAPPLYRMLHSSNGACFWNIVVNLPCAWTVAEMFAVSLYWVFCSYCICVWWLGTLDRVWYIKSRL